MQTWCDKTSESKDNEIESNEVPVDNPWNSIEALLFTDLWMNDDGKFPPANTQQWVNQINSSSRIKQLSRTHREDSINKKQTQQPKEEYRNNHKIEKKIKQNVIYLNQHQNIVNKRDINCAALNIYWNLRTNELIAEIKQ